MRSHGRVELTVTCPTCGQEVELVYEYDRSTNFASWDGSHRNAGGAPCDVPEDTAQRAIDNHLDGYDADPYGGDGPDD